MDEKLEQKYRCYMKDCGCTPEQSEEYLSLAEKGQTQEQIYLLKRHRNQVMDQLHAVTRQVDCIDFVLHELEHEKQGGYINEQKSRGHFRQPAPRQQL